MDLKNKDMISVIIPTLWKSEGFIDRLVQISNIDLVGEIILIDNAPQEIDISYIPKLNHIKESENIFVLPAWNKGVSLAKYDKLLIVNDDVETDWNVINLVYPHITEDKGIIGAGGKCWDNPQGEFRIEEIDSLIACYACLFFIHKNSYIFVPHEFKIHYGDNWLFNQIKKIGKSNYSIEGWVMGGESEQTSGLKEFDEIKNMDANVYYRFN
jgi:hypothetical protein